MITILRVVLSSPPSMPCIHTCPLFLDKHFNRQAKIMGKLLGERKSGSKKRWYPVSEAPSIPVDISKPKNPNKNTSRRVAVLNKLFMTHITDLLASGEASEEIVGKGLEISKVKVHTDFHGINVFWVAKGNEEDDKVEEILKRCSGPLRHELSQLRLMGEVPKITFVKDKMYANIAEVQNILQKCDFGDDHVKPSNSALYDFTGYAENERVEGDREDEPLPVMKHDVFGLDYKKIMERILTKMKKSKEAWDRYEHNLDIAAPVEVPNPSTGLESLRRKLEESKSKEEEFQKVLKQKRVEKKVSSRKEKYEFCEQHREDYYNDEYTYWRGEDEGDYIEEEEKHDGKLGE